MRPADLLASVLLFSSTCAAAWDPIEALKAEVAPLFRRQDSDNSNNNDNNNDNADSNADTGKKSFDLSFTAPQGNTATTESTSEQTGDAKTTGDPKEASSTGDSGAKDSGDKTTGTAKETGSPTGTKKHSSKTYDARLPAGGVSMITPNPMSTSYYKIHDYITFAWNYTSLSVTPTAVDILASCSQNQQTYTIALNQTVEETQKVTWDTGNFQATATVPLLTSTYTLIVYDAAGAVSDRPQAGYLGVFNQFTFGMYSPQPYTPMADYVCATCNSAMSLAEKQTYVGLLAMAGLTVLSFGWFTGVAGLW
jgi:hypothetical protein